MLKFEEFRTGVNRIVFPAAIAFLMFSSASGTRGYTPVFNPSLEIPRLTSKIVIDGVLDEEGWLTAGKADNFTERSPGDNTEPEVQTETFITYDDEKLYVAFRCHDDPAAVRATMCQRDQFHGDDAVGLLIDTYGDASWAYDLMVNPYGVQKDYLWSNVGGGDRGFDLVWESAARLTDFGYQVEMAVPFSSLRFPNKDIQSWRVDFYRNRPRESFMQYSWAAYDRNEQCWPCQWGTLNGMTDVRPGKGLEILPTLVGHQAGQLNDYSDPNPSFENGKAKSELSLGGKYSISSALTLEGAYNPDFSQIEADAAQIDVNSTIALFYPERRPFFQEGSDIFRTIFNSFYTRTVNDPQFAVKFTGRMNRTNIGFLTALDENTPYIIPLEERSVLINTGESYVNILRASRTLAEDTHLGFIVTDRRFENDGYGTVFGLDGNIR
jgi:hypothetical protein